MEHPLVAMLLCACPAAAWSQDVPTLPVEGARDVSGEGLAFAELTTERESCFVGEELTLRLRIGLEAGFEEASLIQLFRRQLDVPVQVQAEWLQGLPGALVEAPEGRAEGARATLAVNDSVARALRLPDRTVAERSFHELELALQVVPTRPGELAIPAPRLRFAYATSFRPDLLHGRVPADRHDAYVLGNGLTLSVRPLPEQDRPPDFGGAVGRFTVRAEADPREIEPGESLALVLRIEGTGDLERFETPHLDRVAGFHVRGTIDDRNPDVRTVIYDLAPRDEGVREVPPIPFTFFDPTADPDGAYVTVTTSPIPVRVLPRSSQEPSPAEAGSRAEPAGNGSAPAVSGGTLLFAIAGTGLVVIAILVLARRARTERDPRRERARLAADAFRARIDQPGADATEALVELLAALLDCPPPAVVAPDLAGRLAAAGVPAPLASRTAELVEALVGERYGGGTSPDGARAARRLVDELEHALASGA